MIIIAILVLLIIIVLLLIGMYGAIQETREHVLYIKARTHETWEMVMNMSVSWKRRMDANLPVSPDYWNYDDPDGLWIGKR